MLEFPNFFITSEMDNLQRNFHPKRALETLDFQNFVEVFARFLT